MEFGQYEFTSFFLFWPTVHSGPENLKIPGIQTVGINFFLREIAFLAV